ncbi:hypothetical protein AB751O23_AL_00050 [Chlamydiales bacterium SCGC AB-751-O23]|jgi:hypothetical protein|nr:hypothetical protein AB751O23_AL_00050 [Chlamydiales bacterium SCGC AB-751-O23]
MQVKSLNTNSASYLKSKLGDLKKNDAIEDLFNNSVKQEEDTPSIKLRLSSTLQSLQDQFSEEVEEFLGQNPKIKGQLKEVKLPSNEYTRYFEGADFTLRKLKSYLTWHEMEQTVEKSTAINPKHPFKEIQKEEKDEEIKSLFQEYNSRVEEVKQKRKQNTPNYYYLFFPETYNFN